jgi:hypothetical protein
MDKLNVCVAASLEVELCGTCPLALDYWNLNAEL